jgi:putative sugar O-methyltransferase
MRLKLKHLRHPLRSANVAKSLVMERWKTQRFAYLGERHFAGDARYDPQSVTEGFAERIDNSTADTALLERICDSYIKAATQEKSVPAIYRATAWWQQQRELSLDPVIQALKARNVAALRRMYSNFYRDPCSGGLIAAQALSQHYSGGPTKDFHRRLFLVDALYRIDYWKARMGERFSASDLAGPSIGNPFGVVIDGTLIRVGSEYQHYCAHRISRFLKSERAVVAEIGGGFGGMAYYLLRDRPATTYIDFDVPESIALAAYYLSKSFPRLNVLLYGEGDLTEEAISQSDIVLLPAFELAAMPSQCVDVTFSSHAISDLTLEAVTGYLESVAKITRKDLLCIGQSVSSKVISEVVENRHPSWRLGETRVSRWHDHRMPGVSEMEFVYRVCGPNEHPR